jgi:hypothetical protein
MAYMIEYLPNKSKKEFKPQYQKKKKKKLISSPPQPCPASRELGFSYFHQELNNLKYVSLLGSQTISDQSKGSIS